MKPYFYSASEFYKEKFSCKVYKVSIDAGCTCPNRDGKKSFGGCIFCSENGSGEFAESAAQSISCQIENGINRIKSKCKNGKYIAYFQNFTNTYGDENVLLEKYKQAIEIKDVVALDIATRPDCIEKDFLIKIEKIIGDKFLIIELGLQTSNEKTGETINRKYTDDDYINALSLIKKFLPDAHVVTHLIFGLPGESENDMISSVRFVCDNKTDGIKITNLNVLKNTKMEKIFQSGKYECLSEEEYFGLIGKVLKIIPEEIVIHRLTGDGAKNILVAPKWIWDKKKVMNDLNRYLKESKIIQGMECY